MHVWWLLPLRRSSCASTPAGALCGCKATCAPLTCAPLDSAQPSTGRPLQPVLPCSGCSQLLLSNCTFGQPAASSRTRDGAPSIIPTALPLLPAAKCILKWAVQRDNCWCPQCKAPFQYLFTYRNLDGTLNDFPQEESVVLLKRAEWFVASLKVSLDAPGLACAAGLCQSHRTGCGGAACSAMGGLTKLDAQGAFDLLWSLLRARFQGSGRVVGLSCGHLPRTGAARIEAVVMAVS